MSPSRRPTSILTLDPTERPGTPSHTESPIAAGNAEQESPSPTQHAITSVSWAPSCGRSFHLVATGGRDGRVRIWRLKPGVEDPEAVDETVETGQEESRWSAQAVADFEHHKYGFITTFSFLY